MDQNTVNESAASRAVSRSGNLGEGEDGGGLEITGSPELSQAQARTASVEKQWKQACKKLREFVRQVAATRRHLFHTSRSKSEVSIRKSLDDLMHIKRQMNTVGSCSGHLILTVI